MAAADVAEMLLRLGTKSQSGRATGPADVELRPDPPVCWAWSTPGAAEPGAAPLPGGGRPAQRGPRHDLLLATVSGAVHRVPVVPNEPRPFWVTMPQVGHAASPAGMLAGTRSPHPVVPDEPRPFWVTMPQVGHAASPAGMLACARSHACGELLTCGQGWCFRVFA